MPMLIIGLLSALMTTAHAASDPAPLAQRPWRVMGEYLYYLPANSGSGLADQLGSLGDGLVAGGYDSTAKSVTTHGGAGARLSTMRYWDTRTSLGLSIDYVLGPTMNADFRANSTTFGNGGLTINRSGTYVRLLGQAHIQLLGKTTPRQGDWNLHFQSAIGPGFGHIDQTCEASGSLSCPIKSTTVNWIGVAWEFGPRLTIHVRDVDAGAAVLIAGFPRYKGNTDVATVEWQTLGFSLSAEF